MNSLCICCTATVAEMETETTQTLLPYAGYVEQFDTLVDTLTCQEMLLYTAQLKRPCSEPLAAKQAAVEVLLSKLCLSTCANTQIGSYLKRGISGGQAKRLNIGIALITDPRVLFLDGESHSSSCQRCRAESHRTRCRAHSLPLHNSSSLCPVHAFSSALYRQEWLLATLVLSVQPYAAG